MIIRIVGGLGNQMFCYACGYAYAKQNSEPLCMDVSQYKYSKFRSFGLDMFRIYERKQVIIPFQENIVGHVLRRIYVECKYNVCNEGGIKPCDNRRECYIDGYWQDQKYFEKYKEDIKRQFTLKAESDELIRFRKDAMIYSCSLHVRRGDYTKLGCCLEPSYYRNALKMMDKKQRIDRIFIFSDDIMYCKEIFKDNERCIYVPDNYKLTDVEEMIAMSVCNHHIIANSTFSWWGAYLGWEKKTVIIRPKNWDSTVCPNEWIALE